MPKTGRRRGVGGWADKPAKTPTRGHARKACARKAPEFRRVVNPTLQVNKDNSYKHSKPCPPTSPCSAMLFYMPKTGKRRGEHICPAHLSLRCLSRGPEYRLGTSRVAAKVQSQRTLLRSANHTLSANLPEESPAHFSGRVHHKAMRTRIRRVQLSNLSAKVIHSL
eukprot:6285554-Amphidinium_carterae.2